MKVLLIGSGGREHALAWKIKQSPKVKKLYCAPGNAGIAAVAECIALKADDIKGLLKFAKDKKIDLTVVGPEAPLVAGIVDEFEKAGLKVFGPRKKAAQLEGSKVFTKEFLRRQNIPTSTDKIFDSPGPANAYVEKADYPLVVKAEGLAAGKGVVICHNHEQAHQAIQDIMVAKVFKDAGRRVVIEEYLEGVEASILAISDGDHFVLLEPAQDHKRIFDDDRGPNTGGMGAYSPNPFVSPDLLEVISETVIEPTIRGMKSEGNVFKGVLYAGLMLTKEGPKVLEFNVRMGDPETQAVLPRLKTDLVDVMLAAIDGKLDKVRLEWDKRPCVCVVISAGGYPGTYDSGKEIFGLDKVPASDAWVFHAGTKLDGGKIVTAGGRVLGVVSLGDTLEKAIGRVYRAVDQISFEHHFFRRDIGQKAVQRADQSL